MPISRIDFGVMATSTDVTSIKAAEEARPLADQHNFQTQFNNEVENHQHQVNAKNDIGQGELNANAEDKGSNEYMGDGGKNRRQRDDKDKSLDRQLSPEQMEKISESIRGRDGRPLDLHISKGFDLKI